MALRNPCFKDQSWSPLRKNRRERRREEGRRRRRRRGRASKAKLQRGMELLTLCMDAWILYGLHGIVSFICLNACLQT